MNKKELVKILKAIGHIRRYELLEIIKKQDGISQNQLIHILKMPQTSAFFHLKKLEDSKLIITKQKQSNIFYYKNEDLIKQMKNYSIF